MTSECLMAPGLLGPKRVTLVGGEGGGVTKGVGSSTVWCGKKRSVEVQTVRTDRRANAELKEFRETQ